MTAAVDAKARAATPIMISAIREDGSRYAVEKLKAHQSGVLHDAVSVFIFDGDRLLLQRRAHDKYHCGGLWANTCCSHPNWGEGAAACANRRLAEELGAAARLEERATIEYRADVGGGLVEHERVRVFAASVERARFLLSPNPLEVADTAWTPLLTIADDMDADPGRFAPWFRIYWSRWGDLNLGER